MGPGRKVRTAATAAVLALALVAGTGCTDAAAKTSIVDALELKIGIKTDQPGLGWKTGDGDHEGFEVDVAYYIADQLGVKRGDVEFVEATSKHREEMVQRGTVDLVLATYSIRADRKTEVAFGGPYYVAHQDILVQASDTSVDSVADLEGKQLCQGAGSGSGDRVTNEIGVDAEVVDREDYSSCIDLLAKGEIDAVSTDDLILAGYVEDAPGAFRMVNAPFTNERYGVGIAEWDIGGCEAVNRAIARMYQTGEGGWLLRKWFGGTGLEINTSVPQFEGCR